MTKGVDRRKRFFDKYTNQLKILKENKLLPESLNFKEGVYLCPICLNEFTEHDLDLSSTNMLTLEDAPPKSLGGHSRTLTCKACNSRCGHEIDFHLTERLIEIDVRAFLPKVIAKAKLTHKGVQVQGEVKISEDGTISVIHREKYNHPEKLKKYVSSTGKDDLVEIEFNASRVDKHRLEVALLKTAYILAFEQYGYALILSSAFDIVRKQLENPDSEIYPQGFWTKQTSFKREHEGVHFVNDKEFEGFYAIFLLKTKSSETRFGVYLPLAKEKTQEVIENLKGMEGGFAVKMISYMANDYFEDIENMRLMFNHMKNKNE